MMFSTNPFAHFASSIHVFPPLNSFLETEKDDLHINNQLTTTNPFVAGDCCLHPYSPSSFTTSKQDSCGNLEGLGLEQYDDEHNHHVLRSEASPRKKKKPSKKDHHSKIYTAQGPRDRRVRLSIDVARKFFYLQDFLGFDKASKTLDWLFNKSKIPIDELIQGRKNSSSPTVTDESEIVFLEAFKEGSDEFEEDKGQKRKSKTKCSNGKRKKIPRKYKSEGPVNQSRAEARARARERTKETLSIKMLDDESKKIHGDCCSCCCCPGSPLYSKLQSSFWNAIKSQNHHDDKFGEALMEEKISMLHSYQHPHRNSINGDRTLSEKVEKMKCLVELDRCCEDVSP